MLSKLDGDARGGAALSVKAVTGKPIKFIGTGEKLDQIEPFHPGRMASRILGMGDVLTLIEKAEAGVRREKGRRAGAEAQVQQIHPLRISTTSSSQLKSMGSLEEIRRHDARHERRSAQGRARWTKRPWPAPRPSSCP